jgi:hypothetical protein
MRLCTIWVSFIESSSSMSFKTLTKGMLRIICPKQSNFEVVFFAVQWNSRGMSILSSAFLVGNDQQINVVLQIECGA